jgi:hypothetical protein
MNTKAKEELTRKDKLRIEAMKQATAFVGKHKPNAAGEEIADLAEALFQFLTKEG